MMTSFVSLLLVASIEGPVYDPGLVRPEDGDTPAEIEVSRIRRHLSQVEESLRANPPAGLTDAQQAARARALDALHEYWQAGQFPKNRDFLDRRLPYFIDADGTACAVGHLMIESGDDALAREIATYENNDFVEQIDHPGVPGWLDRNGLLPWEAAWIQPSYGPCGFGEMPLVCGTDGNTYLCEYVAVRCAGVEVAHEGPCGSATTGGATDTGVDPGQVIGEEICAATETTGGIGTGGATDAASTGTPPTTGGPGGTAGGSGGGGSAGDGPGVTAGTVGGSGGADSSSGTGASEGSDKGCSCRTTPSRGAAGLGLGLLALVAAPRRRRRGTRRVDG